MQRVVTHTLTTIAEIRLMLERVGPE
jgi:hypothetical protein